jgi:uncharacterized coiled-coil DUF342 family protein
MNRVSKTLAVLTVVTLGVWGCARNNGEVGQAERAQALENKCKKLEGDYRSVVTVRDDLRKQLSDLREDRDHLQKDLEVQQTLARDRQALAKERDDLVQHLGARTTERDAAQTQLEQVRKGLRSLLGQAEASTTNSSTTTSTSTAAPPIATVSENAPQ